MARPLRHFAAARYWYITDRCSEERFFLRPDPWLTTIIVHALATAMEATGVGLVCFVIQGNHWHLIVRAAEDPLSVPKFAQMLKSSVARQVNQKRKRHGALWAHRYHAQPILDAASLIGRVLYTLMNPVRAGLAATAAEYPGLSSLEANVGMRPACGKLNLQLELPPQWADLDESELAKQRAWLRSELRRQESEVKAKRIAEGLHRPKAVACMRVDPFSRPVAPAREPAPLCFASTELVRRAYADLRRAFVAAYAHASRLFRNGAQGVAFPAGAFPPRLLRALVEATA